MSNVVTSLLRSRKLGISFTEKALILFMGDLASDDGCGIWASKARMARELETTERTIQRTIEKLKKAGFVEESGRRKHQNGFTVEYEICVDVIEKCEKSTPAPPTQRRVSPQDVDDETQDMTPDTLSPPTHCHPTPDSVSPQDPTVCHPNPIGTILEPKEPPCSPPKQKRAVALPEDWVPSEKNIQDAHSRNFTDEEIRNEADSFRDYHIARGTTFKDWNAAWRTWLGNVRKFQGRRMAGGTKPYGHGQGGSLASIAAQRRASGKV